MQIGHVAVLDRAAQAVGIVREPHAVPFEHIAGSADRGGSVIAVLGHAVPRPGHDETGAGRYVERVLAVAARPDDVDGRIIREIDPQRRVQ